MAMRWRAALVIAEVWALPTVAVHPVGNVSDVGLDLLRIRIPAAVIR